MATLTVSVGALSDSKTISAGDVTRVLSAGRIRWGAGLTDAQVFTLVAGMLATGIRDLVITAETQTAVTAVPPIGLA